MRVRRRRRSRQRARRQPNPRDGPTSLGSRANSGRDVDRGIRRTVVQQVAQQSGERRPARSAPRWRPRSRRGATSCISNTNSAFSCSQTSDGAGRRRRARRRDGSARAGRRTAVDEGEHVQPVPHVRSDHRHPRRPSSSSSSRRSATSWVSPSSRPPPGSAHRVAVGNSKRTSSTRWSGARTMARAAWRMRRPSVVHQAVLTRRACRSARR